MAVSIVHYLILTSALFAISLTGVMLHRKNIIMLLMCIELMLLAINTNFIAFSHMHQNMHGEIFVFFILTVAAAEAAIGLALVVLLYRQKQTIDVESMNTLRG